LLQNHIQELLYDIKINQLIELDDPTMNDRRFFFQPVKKFSYPNPKKQCSDYLQELGVQLVVITYGCKIYITGGIIPLVQLITSHAYNQRCYFEVIPPETPVKLYFDIDHAGQVDVDAYKEFEELFIDTVVRRLEPVGLAYA